MSLVKLMASPCRRALPFVSIYEPISPVACKTLALREPNLNYLYKNSDHQFPVQRSIHVTSVRRDLEGAFKCIGAGVACTAIIGPGVGMGILFGNLVAGTARNPSLANKLFQFAIMGAAFTESLALFSLMIAFLCLS